MKIPGTHNLIYQISLVGQKEKSFRIFIKAPYGVNADWIAQIFRNSRLLPLFLRAAYNSFRLVKQKQNLLFLLFYSFSIHIYGSAGQNLFPGNHRMAVNHNPSFGNKPVCLTPGTNPCLT